MIDKKRIFSKLPYSIQLPVAKAYCNHKKKWIKDLNSPVTLIFFVTARCSHCFFCQEINTPSDAELSIDEIRKIARSFEHPVSLSLTEKEIGTESQEEVKRKNHPVFRQHSTLIRKCEFFLLR